jgi:hypothetical protein
MRITAIAEAAMLITPTSSPTGVICRGTSVLFTASFTNRAGDSIDPDAAELEVLYPLNGAELTATMPMEKVAGTWQAIWQSEVSGAGLVSYCIVAAAGDDEGRADGHLRLTAGGANPEPN